MEDGMAWHGCLWRTNLPTISKIFAASPLILRLLLKFFQLYIANIYRGLSWTRRQYSVIRVGWARILLVPHCVCAAQAILIISTAPSLAITDNATTTFHPPSLHTDIEFYRFLSASLHWEVTDRPTVHYSPGPWSGRTGQTVRPSSLAICRITNN